MNQFQLLVKILPSLFPLIVFIVVDELYGTSAGLTVAIGFGIAQLLYTFIREKVLDTFTLFDTMLIVILGSISYLLENDLFFKLKPALVGAIFCCILGISSYSRTNIMALLSKRYLKEIPFNDEHMKQFRKSTKALFYLFSFHTLLVLYSALFMSKEAWAFISTVLLYLLFGGYFGYEFIALKVKNNKYKKEEWLPLVDEKGTVIGQAPRSVVHSNKDLLHPVVHLHVINRRKQLFLQKRPASKLVQPGKWDTSVGGHVSVNQTIDAALFREAKEELGIVDFTPVFVCRYLWRSEIESELVFLYYTVYDGEIMCNAEEIDEGRFWNISEINRNLKTGTLTPNFEIEFGILKKMSLM
jgi:isopentenyldiphosphate isomerase/intracellular septation protein A